MRYWIMIALVAIYSCGIRPQAAGASLAPFTTLTSLADASIDRVVVDPNNPAIILAANGWQGLINRSTDGGSTWTSISVGVLGPQEAIRGIAVNPKNSKIVIAASYLNDLSGSGNLYKSADGGVTWTVLAAVPIPSPTLPSLVRNLFYNSAGTALLLINGYQGVSRSTDGGMTWTNTLPQAQGIGLRYPAADSNNANGMWVPGVDGSTGNNTLWHTTDFGQTWVSVPVTFPIPANPSTAWTVAIQPSTKKILVPYRSYDANTGADVGGVVASTNGGKTWSPSSTGLGEGFAPSASIVFDPTSPATVLMAAATPDPAGLYLSTNSGASWTAIGQANGLKGADGSNGFFIAAARPAGTGIAAALIAAGPGYYTSVDHGTTWTVAKSGIMGDSAALLAEDGITAKGIYTAGFSAHLYHSTNAGVTWTETDGWTGSKGVVALVVDRVTTGRPVYVLAGAPGPVLYRSVNAGAAWKSLAPPIPTGQILSGVITDSLQAGHLYLTAIADPSIADNTAASNTLLVSADGGTTWTNVAVGSADGSFTAAGATGPLAFDPNAVGTIYAGLSTGLWKSTDSGSHWSKSNALPVFTLAAIGASPTTLYAGAEVSSAPRLRKSIDGGTTWTTVTQPLGVKNGACPAGQCRYYALAATPAAGSGGLIAYSINSPFGPSDNTVEIDLTTNGGTTWHNIDAPLGADVEGPAVVGSETLYVPGAEVTYAAPIAKLAP